MPNNINMSRSEEVMNAVNSIITFVKPIDIKTYCPVDAQTNDVRLKKSINTSQGREIKKALGPTLFTKLMNEWVANGKDITRLPNLSSIGTPPLITDDPINYQELMTYVQPALIWWSFATVLPFISVKIGEKGLTLPQDQYGTAADQSWYNTLLKEAKDQAQSEQQALIDYICETLNDDQTIMNEAKDVGTNGLQILYPSRMKRRLSRYNRCKTCK